MTERQKDALSRGNVKRNVICARAFMCSLLKDPRNQITMDERHQLRAIEHALCNILQNYHKNTYDELRFNKKKLPKDITIVL